MGTRNLYQWKAQLALWLLSLVRGARIVMCSWVTQVVSSLNILHRVPTAQPHCYTLLAVWKLAQTWRHLLHSLSVPEATLEGLLLSFVQKLLVWTVAPSSPVKPFCSRAFSTFGGLLAGEENRGEISFCRSERSRVMCWFDISTSSPPLWKRKKLWKLYLGWFLLSFEPTSQKFLSCTSCIFPFFCLCSFLLCNVEQPSTCLQ